MIYDPTRRSPTSTQIVSALCAALVGAHLHAQDLEHEIDGNEPLERFGASCAYLGDVNGDGAGDLLVGAPGATLFSARFGAVHVISGQTGATLFVVRGTQVGSEFGCAVAAIGDIDGDGRSEFAVGSRGFDGAAGIDSGRVTLFRWQPAPFGGIEPSPMWNVEGSEFGEGFGAAVSGGHDVNNDGTADVVVGAPSHDGPTFPLFDVGRAVVLRGMDGTQLQQIRGVASGDQVGSSVATLGDNNGDGHAEWAAGAPFDDSIDIDHGDVFVVDGQSGLGFAGQTGLGGVSLGPGARLGAAIANAGDVDGDGLDDLAVGAPAYSPPPSLARGYAAVWNLGGGAPRWTRTGSTDRDGLGASIAGGGDFNGDGIPDVVAGAPGDDFYGDGAGSVRTLSGSNGHTLAVLHGKKAGDRMGTAVSIGELTPTPADGFAEVIGTSPVAGPPTEFGSVRIWRVNDLESTAPFAGNNPGQRFGQSVTFVGDVDQDGTHDFAIASRLDSAGGPGGEIEVRRGSDGLLLQSWTTPSPIVRVEALGDSNGDGLPEVLVTDTTTRSRIYSCSDGSLRHDLGVSTLARSIGDYDGDGLADVALVFGPSTVGPNIILTIQVWSSATLQGTTVATQSVPVFQKQCPFIPPANSSIRFFSLFPLGDVDGDGRSDFAYAVSIDDLASTFLSFRLIARFADGSARSLFVGFGFEALFTNAGAAAAGDVDGDGVGDILVAQTSLASAGAQVVRGDTGAILRQWSWDEVVTTQPIHVGDLDGDGTDDFAVPELTDRMLFLSGADGSVVYSIPTSGAAAIGSPGDSNGDGFFDIAIGDPSANNDEGVAHLLTLPFDSAPPRSVRRFAACEGSIANFAHCDTLGRPALGAALTFQLRNVLPGAPATVLLGPPSDADLGPVGAPGCRLRVAPWTAPSAFSDARGLAQVPLTIPDDPNLLGLSIRAQWLVLDPLANALGLTVSDVQEITVGQFR